MLVFAACDWQPRSDDPETIDESVSGGLTRRTRLNPTPAALKAKFDRANSAFTEGSLELSEFKDIKNPLVVRKADLEQRLARVETDGAILAQATRTMPSTDDVSARNSR
jgi:hypothetical protein